MLFLFVFTAISLLKDREPGAFVIRDSHSFQGAYGLAMKVACPPPTVQQNKKGYINLLAFEISFILFNFIQLSV